MGNRNPKQEHNPKREDQIHNMDFGITGVDLALFIPIFFRNPCFPTFYISNSG